MADEFPIPGVDEEEERRRFRPVGPAEESPMNPAALRQVALPPDTSLPPAPQVGGYQALPPAVPIAGANAPGGRPSSSDPAFQAVTPTGWRKGLGALFTGMAAFQNPRAGQAVYNQLFREPVEAAQQSLTQAQHEYDTQAAQERQRQQDELQRKNVESEIALRQQEPVHWQQQIAAEQERAKEANALREQMLGATEAQRAESNRMREEALQGTAAQRAESNAMRRESMENTQQNRAELEAWRKETEANRTAEQSAHMAERFDDKYQQPYLKNVARANTLKAELSKPGPIGNIDNSIMMELIENTRPDKGFRMSEPILKREFSGTDWADRAERFFSNITTGAQLGDDQRKKALTIVDELLENQRQNLIETAKRRKISPDYIDERILGGGAGRGPAPAGPSGVPTFKQWQQTQGATTR